MFTGRTRQGHHAFPSAKAWQDQTNAKKIKGPKQNAKKLRDQKQKRQKGPKNKRQKKSDRGLVRQLRLQALVHCLFLARPDTRRPKRKGPNKTPKRDQKKTPEKKGTVGSSDSSGSNRLSIASSSLSCSCSSLRWGCLNLGVGNWGLGSGI